MISFGMALLLWLVWAAALSLWSSPSREERNSLDDYGAGRVLANMLPLSHWRDELAPIDWPAFTALRRRVGLAALLAVLPLLLLPFTGTQPTAPPEPPAPTQAAAPPAPAPEPAAPVEPEPGVVYLPPPPKPSVPNVDERGWVTVTQDDQEAISEERTPTRLYAEARVRPIYANEDLHGIRILGVEPDSFWHQVGVRDGDIVLEANGELIDNPDASVRFMNSLSREYELILRVRGEDGDERILEHRTPR